MADLPNCLRSQWNNTGNTRRADASGELQKRDRQQDDSHLLNTAAQLTSQLLLVLLLDFDAQGGASHTLSMEQNIFYQKCFIRNFSDGPRPRSSTSLPKPAPPPVSPQSVGPTETRPTIEKSQTPAKRGTRPDEAAVVSDQETSVVRLLFDRGNCEVKRVAERNADIPVFDP